MSVTIYINNPEKISNKFQLNIVSNAVLDSKTLWGDEEVPENPTSKDIETLIRETFTDWSTEDLEVDTVFTITPL